MIDSSLGSRDFWRFVHMFEFARRAQHYEIIVTMTGLAINVIMITVMLPFKFMIYSNYWFNCVITFAM